MNISNNVKASKSAVYFCVKCKQICANPLKLPSCGHFICGPNGEKNATCCAVMLLKAVNNAGCPKCTKNLPKSTKLEDLEPIKKPQASSGKGSTAEGQPNDQGMLLKLKTKNLYHELLGDLRSKVH